MMSVRELSALCIVAMVGLGATFTRASEQHSARPAAEEAKVGEPRAATVPFTLDHNRMIVRIELVRADGSVVPARAWVDTGTEIIGLTEPVAREVGLDLSDIPEDADPHHSVRIAAPVPGVRVGGESLDLSGVATWVRRGTTIMPGVPAEVHLGAGALRHNQVVLDYPRLRLTVARPGVLQPRGVAVPCRVNPSTGLFMISTMIDGEEVDLGLDNGSAGTWVSKTLTSSWQARHPEWRHVTGALGSANFWGFGFETEGVLMRLPELAIGPLRVRDVALLGLGQGLFDWYSRKSAGPVSGFLGANVLKRFRLEIDLPNRTTYWEAGPPTDDHDLDMVGLTVRAEDTGGFSVAGVVSVKGSPAVPVLGPGDRLVRIGTLDADGATMGEVMAALHGRPGASRTLVVERDGRRITVPAKVMSFP